jgi:hypothetical protein
VLATVLRDELHLIWRVFLANPVGHYLMGGIADGTALVKAIGRGKPLTNVNVFRQVSWLELVRSKRRYLVPPTSG